MNGTAGNLVMERRFNGPPESAHGGLACGRFAGRAQELLGGTAPGVVTLHAPPPLDVQLRIERAGNRVHIWHEETLVASVSRAEARLGTVPFVPPDLIADAERGYPSAAEHPFPTCFVCGPLRSGTDGLGLAPGQLPGRPGITGCRWTPDASLGAGHGQPVPPEFAWAALDCPGGWTADLVQAPMVLKRFTVLLTEPPIVGTPHVVVGERDADDGHALTTRTALYLDDGTLVGRALAQWVRLAPRTASG
ncbi:hypothetical protein [Streptomyces sp. LN549]|uniref:hypothetical protein n=1 Tax=Streptomyces sp. LN549 TaxID=3112979 RepID=UPI003718F21A